MALEAIAHSDTMIESSPRRRYHLASDEDVIPEVDELLPVLQRLLADRREGDHRLNPAAVAGLEGGEAELARVAAEHHTSGDGCRHARLSAGLEVSEALTQRGDRVGDRQDDGIGAAAGILPLHHKPFALGEADRLLFEDLLLGRSASSAEGTAGAVVSVIAGGSSEVGAQSIRGRAATS